MKTIKPFSKDVERIFDSITKNGKAYIDDINITRNLGRKYPDLFDDNNGFMDIARIDKRKKSIVIPRMGVQVVPLPEPDSESMKIRRKKKYGFFRV